MPQGTTTVAAWPRTTRCPGCHTEVIHARHHGPGRPVVLDPIPVLPEGRCGACCGTGRRSFDTPLAAGGISRETYEPGDLYGRTRRATCTCIACHGTGLRGEPLGPDHILVDPDGRCRPHTGDREPWEAAHRRHRCPT